MGKKLTASQRGLLGAHALNNSRTPAERSKSASNAAKARWAKKKKV